MSFNVSFKYKLLGIGKARPNVQDIKNKTQDIFFIDFIFIKVSLYLS